MLGAIVGVDLTHTWALPSAATQWNQLASSPLSGLRTMAFDSRRGSLVAQGATMLELENGTWNVAFGPAAASISVGDLRRGSVALLRGGSGTWERLDGVWYERARPPVPLVFHAAAYAPDTGSIFALGTLFSSCYLLRHTWKGASPPEACDGGDRDGDGFVDCADPDCWWSCSPQCPPYASCP
jgi:hypothetical protein